MSLTESKVKWQIKQLIIRGLGDKIHAVSLFPALWDWLDAKALSLLNVEVDVDFPLEFYNAPINVKPLRGGGEAGHRRGIWTELRAPPQGICGLSK